MLEDLRDCFGVGAGRGVVIGGSAALLDKMFENAIGSDVLTTFGSSLLFMGCLERSMLLRSRDGGRSVEPLGRFADPKLP